MKTAKARVINNRIVVDVCPYCGWIHYHLPPIGDGIRLADCFKGEYVLDFTIALKEQS